MTVYKLTIEEELENKQDFIYVVQEVARQIEQGYTSGIDPSWDIIEVTQ